jgi:adenine-specific DNA-methyltransferase
MDNTTENTIILKIKLLFQQSLSSILKDLASQSENASYIRALNKYNSLSDTLLKPYKHHLGYSFDTQNAGERFRVETTLLWLITQVAQKHLELLGNKVLGNWPVNNNNEILGWFVLPSHFTDRITQIAQLFTLVQEPALILSEICGDVMSKTDDSIIGEFYTPINIVDHLIALSKIAPHDIINGKKVIDPACGAGIILLRLFSQTAQFSKRTMSTRELIGVLASNIFGFDIQPFAIFATKTLLLYSSYLIFGNEANFVDENTFSQIVLTDTLLTNNLYWSDPKFFDFILGNPPYMTVKGNDISNIEEYRTVLFGHPNLYQFFIWWALRAAKEKGIVCFLVPQSMMSGIYYKNLRAAILKYADLLGITRFISSKGIIGNADIQMMAICFSVTNSPEEDRDIEIRFSKDGNGIADNHPIFLKKDVVTNHSLVTSSAWIISGDHLDYEIFQKVTNSSTLMGECELWNLGNGNYVWNQNKDFIRKESDDGCIPLISATSIKTFGFTFPYLGKHSSKFRQFSIVTKEMEPLQFSGPILLIQRTTPRKIGHRIVASIPPKWFYQEFPLFFLENHVNYIKSQITDDNILYGLLGWINSNLFNYIFMIRNGTNIVSVSELNRMPVNLSLLNHLGIIVKEMIGQEKSKEMDLVNNLNQLVYEKFSITSEEKTHIQSVLNWKEKASDES